MRKRERANLQTNRLTKASSHSERAHRINATRRFAQIKPAASSFRLLLKFLKESCGLITTDEGDALVLAQLTQERDELLIV